MSFHNHPQITAFLHTVCAPVRCREVHDQICHELLDHLEDNIEEALLEGNDENEAILQAIKRMGDPGELGYHLDQAHRPRTEWILLAFMTLFIGMGLCTLYSLQSSGNLMLAGIAPFQRTLIYSVLGLLITAMVYFMDYRRLQRSAASIYALALIGTLWTFLFGPHVQGKPFLVIGPLTIDFVNLSPFLFAIALAGLFLNGRWDGRGWLRALGLILPPLYLYFEASSIAGAITFLIIAMTLLLISGAQRRYVAVLPVGVGGFLFFLTLFAEPYRLDRFTAFLFPASDPEGSGSLYIQIREALRSAGLFGNDTISSAGLISQTIPAIHTDLILTYMIYTFGWIAGLIFIILVGLFLSRLFHVARITTDPFGRSLVIGLSALLSSQFAWAMLMNFGLAPLAGLSVPFTSYGGSMWMVNMATVGLIMGVYRRKNMIPVATAMMTSPHFRSP